MGNKPDSCIILGQKVTIKYVSMSNDHGQCDVALREIRINKKLNDETLERVLRHERFHMKMGIAGISEVLAPEVEEALCNLAESD
jgi:hypothetical protein